MSRLSLLLLLAFVACLLSPASSLAARNGTYVGKDEGKVKVVMKIKNNRVTYFSGDPAGSCYGIGSTLVSFTFPSAAQRPSATSKIKSNGIFSAVFKGSPDVSFKDDRRVLTGKVKGNKVTGRMIVSGLCQADQKFTAVRK
ncbi:MAG: hypothetical protein KDB57_02010 [Solirubrobacterales bacterium]|jgi:hypothetical protein|nr:hypothetical protein [Solirubrobacterales bacterium]